MAEKDFQDANFKWEFYQVSGKLHEFQCNFSLIPKHLVMDVYRVQSLLDKEFADQKYTILALLFLWVQSLPDCLYIKIKFLAQYSITILAFHNKETNGNKVWMVST